MADYTPLLTRAVIGQDEAARQGIYARAREALERQLRGFEPKLDEEQIVAELVGLNTAIETVEAGARALEAPAEPEMAPESAAAAEEAHAAVVEASQDETQEAEAPPASAETPVEEAEAALAQQADDVTDAAPAAEAEASAELATQAEAPPVEPTAPIEEAPAPLAPEAPVAAPALQAGEAGPDEAEVLKAANTDEVSAPPLVEMNLPASRPRMPLRDEAKKSRKPLAMVAGLALIVILGMGGLALTRRTSPDPLRSQKGQTQDVASAEASKTEGRLASEPPARPAETPATPPAASEPAASAPASIGSEATLNTSTRAFMVLESPGNAPSQFEGRALWSFEPDAATKGQKTLRTIVAFPGADLTIDLSLSRNKDASLSASHLLMAVFDIPKGFEPIREMSPIEWREREATAGSVFRGSVVPVQDNVFMVTLDKSAEDANTALLKNQKWIVFEFRLANGRRGATLVEKGASGDKAVAEALGDWK